MNICNSHFKPYYNKTLFLHFYWGSGRGKEMKCINRENYVNILLQNTRIYKVWEHRSSAVSKNEKKKAYQLF